MKSPHIITLCPVLALAAAIALVGCSSSTGSVAERLDQTTGTTITYAEVPLVFYRDNSSQAAFAREFINLGPIEINSMGELRYFVWLGVWSTVQDTSLSRQIDGFETVIVFADGEPLQLDAKGWTHDVIGASAPVYAKPTASTASAYFEVTIDQIRLIAEATDLRLRSTGSRPHSYEPWESGRSGIESLRAFLRHASL